MEEHKLYFLEYKGIGNKIDTNILPIYLLNRYQIIEGNSISYTIGDMVVKEYRDPIIMRKNSQNNNVSIILTPIQTIIDLN